MNQQTAETISEAIRERHFSEPMKRGLVRVLKGQSYRRAAADEGIGYRELHRNAKTVPGLVELHLEAWRKSWGRDFPSLWRHHIERREKAA